MKLARKAGLPLVMALVATMPLAACAAGADPAAGRVAAARMTATGKAGPFAAATATVIRTGSAESGGFSAMLDTGTGQLFPLPGPDDPTDFFIVEPRAILFARIDVSGANGVVILYNSNRIGPGNGTDHKALVYKVEPAGVVREPAVEARLEGAASAAAARAKLGAR